MLKELIKKVTISKEKAELVISKMTPQEKKNLENAWDIEHAYYSSALEGSKLDRDEFEELAKTVNA